MKNTLVKLYNYSRKFRANRVYNRSRKSPKGYKRICHIHIRKTAGTSINSAFWTHAGFSLSTAGRKNILFGNDLVLVRNNTELIDEGKYFYANTHAPFWELNLPEETYTFAIFRDPIERVCSLYRYYTTILELDPATAHQKEPFYDALIGEAQRAKEGFDTFLERTPKSDLANQLFKFSKSFNVNEALDNCTKLSAVFFQDQYDDVVFSLSEVSQLPLKNVNERKSKPQKSFAITEEQRLRLTEFLKDEYSFYTQLRARCSR